MIAIFILAVAILALTCVRVYAPGHLTVGDGDGVYWSNGMNRGRLAGIDAPEWTQPYGHESAAALRAMLQGRHVLVIRYGSDVYGRRIVHLWTAQGPVNLRMALSGNAHGLRPITWLATLPARIAGRGLWAGHNVVHPAVWRTLHPCSSFQS